MIQASTAERGAPTAAPIPTAELCAAGEALYGTNWQTRLAAEAGVNARTVRRWASGDQLAPARLRAVLADLVDRQISRLRKLKAELGTR